MKLLGYIRVSRIGGREGEGYISPAVQREAGDGYATELGGTIVEWLTDEDYSGGTIERPAFQDALSRLDRGEADGLVVFKVDRFARSVADGMKIVRQIVDRGQVFASCSERIDPRTPEGRYMLASFFNNGELFLEQMKAGWWISKRRAIARGVHIGATPIGYQREKSMPLVPHPLYGPAMTELFDRAATGEFTDIQLADWMTERAPPEGRRGWQSSEVRRWLRSRLYLGRVKYGDLVNDDAHPPLTDPETWERCQREPRMQRVSHSRFLLSGLVRCDSCRFSMGGQSYGGAKGETPVYRCTNRDCESPSVILCSRLDAYVTETVKAEVGNRRFHAAQDVEDLAAAERSRDEAAQQRDEMAVDVEARRILGAAKWRESLAAFTAEVERWDARVRELRERVAGARLVESVDELDWHGLRDLLRGSVEAVLIMRGRLPVEQRALIVPKGLELPPVAGVPSVQPADH